MGKIIRRIITWHGLRLIIGVFGILLFAGCSTVTEMGCMKLNKENTDEYELVDSLKGCDNLSAVESLMNSSPVGTYHATNDVTWAIWCYCKHVTDVGWTKTYYRWNPRVAFCKFRNDKLIGFAVPVGTNNCLIGDIALFELESYEAKKILWPIYWAAYNNAHGLSMYFDDVNQYYTNFESGREIDHWEGMTAHFKPVAMTSANGYRRVYAISEEGRRVYADIPAHATYKRYEKGKFIYETMGDSSGVGLYMAQAAIQNLNQISQSYSAPPSRTRTSIPSSQYNQTGSSQSSVSKVTQQKTIPKYTIVPRAPSFGLSDGTSSDSGTRYKTELQRVR